MCVSGYQGMEEPAKPQWQCLRDVRACPDGLQKSTFVVHQQHRTGGVTWPRQCRCSSSPGRKRSLVNYLLAADAYLYVNPVRSSIGQWQCSRYTSILNSGTPVGGNRPIEMVVTRSGRRWSQGGLPLYGIVKDPNAMISWSSASWAYDYTISSAVTADGAQSDVEAYASPLR